MGKNTWDAVLASAPLNSTTGRVTSRKADAYTPNAKVVSDEWDGPPAFKAFVAANAQQIDLSGHRFGRLVVVGYLGDGKWCCRCSCGKYVSRSQKAALNPANAQIDRCTICRHTAYLQREASAEQTKRRRLEGIIGARSYKDGREP